MSSSFPIGRESQRRRVSLSLDTELPESRSHESSVRAHGARMQAPLEWLLSSRSAPPPLTFFTRTHIAPLTRSRLGMGLGDPNLKQYILRRLPRTSRSLALSRRGLVALSSTSGPPFLYLY